MRVGFRHSLGNGVSSVEAWLSTALDIEEVLSGACDEQLRAMVADVVKSFDKVIGPFSTAHSVVSGCLPGSRRFT